MGTWAKFTQRKAAAVLGVSTATVKAMLLDGRLSSPLNEDEVRALRKSWALVPYELSADEASRWDPCWRRCLVCLSFFRIKRSWVAQGRGSTCSIECRDKWRWRSFFKVIYVKPKRTSCKRLFFAGQCVECGAAFVTTRKTTTTCSSVCLTRAHRRLRKARKRGAVKADRVWRRKVYERDKWQCHICGEKIDQALEAPDPRSATLDHIHPLSLGGSHTYDNVKAAHFGCNSSRGNRAEFQMRMPVAA